MSFYDNSIEFMLTDIHFKTDWNNILKKSILQNISEKISEDYYPPKEKIFNAFNHFDFKDLKIVILGQDCYHGPDQANGLSFSVNNGLRIPPSLRNILKELYSDLNIKRVDTNFTDLAEQGILFMNCALTVKPGKPGSHLKIWEGYSNYIINYISKNSENIIFVLWGNFAKSKKSLIDTEKHFIIEGTHPSPLSANRGGFFGTKPFSKINNKLKELGKQEINWI
jgi:uracil-DNA glycosylase